LESIIVAVVTIIAWILWLVKSTHTKVIDSNDRFIDQENRYH